MCAYNNHNNIHTTINPAYSITHPHPPTHHTLPSLFLQGETHHNFDVILLQALCGVGRITASNYNAGIVLGQLL